MIRFVEKQRYRDKTMEYKLIYPSNKVTAYFSAYNENEKVWRQDKGGEVGCAKIS